METVLETQGLGKAWRTYPTGLARAAEVLSLGALRTHRPYWALRDVSLSLPRGAALGDERGDLLVCAAADPAWRIVHSARRR